MSNIYESFGKRVKTQRKRKGYSTYELAKLTGASVGMINNIEHGRYDTFKLELLFNLAKELDSPISSLLDFKPLELKEIVISSNNTGMIFGKTDDIPYETMLNVIHFFNILADYFIKSIAQYDYSKESMETIVNHIIEEFDFLNKINVLNETNPVM